MSNTAHIGDTAAAGLGEERRSESVRTLGLIAMVAGLAGLLGMLGRVLFESKGWWARGDAEDPLGYWPIATAIAGVALSALLFAGGRAAFHVRRRAVPMLRAYAIGSLVVGLAGLALYMRQLPQARARSGWQFPWGGYGTLFEALYWPAALALSVGILIFLSRPRVRAAFATEAAAPGRAA